MSAVKAAPFAAAELAGRLAEAAARAGFRVERYGEAAGCPLLGLTRRTPGSRPRIYLSSGIHGDEPAPPLALLELIRSGVFDDRANWIICPLLNPAGFIRGTRENEQGLDLNRDYRNTRSREIAAHIEWLQRQPNFAMNLCLHEDWEAKGFYLYELNPIQQPTLAEGIVAAVGAVFPVDDSAVIDGRPAKAGILRPIADPAQRELWPESFYLRVHHTKLGYTLETASSFPLERRIAALQTGVNAALNLALEPQPRAAKLPQVGG